MDQSWRGSGQRRWKSEAGRSQIKIAPKRTSCGQAHPSMCSAFDRNRGAFDRSWRIDPSWPKCVQCRPSLACFYQAKKRNGPHKEHYHLDVHGGVKAWREAPEGASWETPPSAAHVPRVVRVYRQRLGGANPASDRHLSGRTFKISEMLAIVSACAAACNGLPPS